MTRRTQETPKAPRPVKPRFWQSLAAGSALALVAGPALAQGLPVPLTAPAAEGGWLWLADAEGGEGGESGVAHGAGSAEAAGFVAALALIEGHLRVGAALYAEGRGDLALTHMKHPGDEIYSDLEPQLAANGAAGFAAELEALAAGVEQSKPAAEVEAAHQAVLAKTHAARASDSITARDKFDAIIAVTRVAAEEYAIGVVDGKIVNLHEYQDAWGFIQTARSMAAELATSDNSEVAAAAAKVTDALDGVAPAFEGLTPEAIAAEGSLIIAAAGAIELAAYGIK